jgi:nitrite reductase/ring-hydroxylating ferredoxin subunit
MSKERLVAFGQRGLEHFQNGTQDRVDQIFQVPAENYTNSDKWNLEMENVFRRLPLVLSCSSELSEPGSYHSIEVLGVPVLVTRGEDRVIRAFLNSCTHRGAVVVPEGTGSSRRHACPYHAWTYNSQGELVGVYEEEHFGQVDYECNGLVELPCFERAGLIWVTLNTNPVVDIDTFLCGYGEMLEYLGLADCHVVGRQVIEGPNWKVAYDGYLDLYHLHLFLQVLKNKHRVLLLSGEVPMNHRLHDRLLQGQKYFCVRPEDGIDLDSHRMQLSNSVLQSLVCQLHDNQLSRDIPTFLHSRTRKCQYQLLGWYLESPK